MTPSPARPAAQEEAERSGSRNCQSETARSVPEKESCVEYMDALWFCYSPVHQMQEYYRFGRADDCVGHWSNLYACLKKRTKFADQVKGEEPKKHFLWTVRSKDEATDFWKREFNKQPVDATGKEPKNLKDPRDEKDSVVI